MRAIAVPEAGAALTLLELPRPKPGQAELLVRVHASSINPIDTYLARGHYRDVELAYPFVPGRDFSGVVAAAGDGVEQFEVGDSVMGFWSEREFLEGAWAEYDVVRAASTIVRKPESLDFEQAAALPLAAVTAALGIENVAPAQGDVVLVTGAAGAVGCYAVQLAARRGAHVIATAKAAHHERVRALGAADVIDYTNEDVLDAVHARYPEGIFALVDLVHDRPENSRLAGLVRDGGFVTSARYAVDKKLLAERGVGASNIVANGSSPQVLADLVALAASGELEIMVDSVVPLEELPEAVDEFLGGGKGKIVVSVAG